MPNNSRYVIDPPITKWVITMDAVRVSSLSLEYVRFPVFADAAGAVVDPTSGSVAMAFIASSTPPSSGNFNSGSWDVSSIGTFTAQILVGPSGTVTLTPGEYYAWVKITATDGEVIVRQVGKLIIQ